MSCRVVVGRTIRQLGLLAIIAIALSSCTKATLKGHVTAPSGAPLLAAVHYRSLTSYSVAIEHGTCETDLHGRFETEVEPAALYDVGVFAHGRIAWRQFLSSSEIGEVSAVLTPCPLLKVRFYGANTPTTGVIDCEILSVGQAPEVIRLRQNLDGTFVGEVHLPRVTSVRVIVPGFQTVTREQVKLTPGQVTEIKAELCEQGQIEGLVIDFLGRPIGQVPVRAYATGISVPVCTLWSDDCGKFKFLGLGNQQVCLVAEDTNGRTAIAGPFQVGATGTTKNVIVQFAE